MKKKLGAIIRQYRDEKDITQEQLSFSADISTRFLQNIEAGDSMPSFPTLFKLSKALEITPDEIILLLWEEWLKKQKK